jgi:cytochrome bd ubiquinol oxidase subunit II
LQALLVAAGGPDLFSGRMQMALSLGWHIVIAARVAAAVAVVGVLWGWGAAQYPYLLEGSVTISEAAAPQPTLLAMLVSLVVGAVVFVPGLVWLLVLFQRQSHARPEQSHARPEG